MTGSGVLSPAAEIAGKRLLVQLNIYGTHAEVSRNAQTEIESSAASFALMPGDSLFGLDYPIWEKHIGQTVDVLELQAVARAARLRGQRALIPWISVDGGDWRTEPPIPNLPHPDSDFAFNSGRRAVACSREHLVHQCLEAPETLAVRTPESGGWVLPEDVGFLVDALRKKTLESTESQTRVAGGLLAVLSAVAWFSGAEARSGWVVLCALAAAWLAVAMYQAGEAERHAGTGYAAAREQHRHAVWLEGRPALLTWALISLLTLVMVGQIYSDSDPIQIAGLVKPLVIEGEVWRLLTGALLHGGLLHLGLNVLAIWSLAPLVEAHSGRPALPILFVASALGGSATSLWLLPETPSVGASGGILGIVGHLFVLGYRRRQSLPQGFVGRMGVGILATGVFGVVGYALVDNAMHAGGLLTGMLLAGVLPLDAEAKEGHDWRILNTLGDVAIATLVLAGAGVMIALLGV
ncbi:MAG: rhomboid family intramembrane serine protease [Gemmatimonadetes bacterium]|nr:rhomboid family intramembrane serine protease [Gemmatimonadota bacterium]